MTTPDALLDTYKQWADADCPVQVASHWNPEAWARQLPEHASFLKRLDTNELDRVQAVEKASKVVDEDTAVEVFLLAMLWGHGSVGYGPFRTRRILDQPDAKSGLLEVAQVAQQAGGLAAFELVANRRKASGSFLKFLGPAFGTKYIYFLTANDPERQPAPVMDAVVYRWFRKHAPNRQIRLDRWDTPSYRTFLESLTEWAEDIHKQFEHKLRLDDVEYLIFADESGFEGNSWSESWDAEQRAASEALVFDQLRSFASSRPDSTRALQLIDELESLLDPADDAEEVFVS